MRRRTACRLVTLVPLLFLTACAEPPAKEMNQAQGAIDAARAAGADQYATEEFNAAVDALARSEQAVGQRDYRLALALAIDSRERAQNAAKIAVDTRAKARGDAERVVAEANLLVTQAVERLDDPQVARLPRRRLAEPRKTIEAAEATMQEAREALKQEDYRRAMALTEGIAERIREALAVIDKALGPPAGRPRR